MSEIIKLDHISQYNELMGVETAVNCSVFMPS